jgi:hypothetical protein
MKHLWFLYINRCLSIAQFVETVYNQTQIGANPTGVTADALLSRMKEENPLESRT